MKHFFFAILIAISFQVSAQDSARTKPQVKAGLNYNTGLNYYGRTDSLKSAGIVPLIEFWITPKFYINAAPVFIHNKQQSFDYAGTVATAGFQNVSEKWITGLYVMKPFYEQGTLVQSALKAQTGVNISRLNNAINLNIGGDVKFSDHVDFGTSAGVDHIIRVQNKDNSVWVLDPSFYAYAGTQQYSNTYTRKQSNGLPLGGVTQQQVTEKVTGFDILSYEISMPVIFAKGNLMFMATPAYVMPKNLITVPARPDLSEQGKNMFYATLGVKYSF